MARIRRTVLSIMAGLALSVGFIAGPGAPGAHAQMRVGSRMGQWGNADQITSADIERFSKTLELTKTQKDALDELHKGYETDFEAARKVMQDKFEKVQAEFQDTQDFSVWQKDWPEAQEKYTQRSAELEKSLLSDLKAMLTPEQAKKWPSAERAQRRAKGLAGMNAPGVTLAGDSVDLIRLVEEQKLKARPETMTQLLDRYETEVDQAIVERDAKRKEIGEFFTKGAKKDKDGNGGGMPDFSKIGEMMGEMRKSGIKVRDINDRYSTLIASAMPDDSRESFAMAYKKAKFPQIFKEPYSLKALNAAREFKDLTSEQKSGVDEIISKYKKEIAAANDRYARAQTDAEKDGGGEDMMGGWMRMMNGGDQGKDDSELAQARKARRKLDTDALDQLKTVLTPEQVERLPERQNDMMMWGGGGKR
jgi:Spy/CpxP family protein refolding chaperone